LLAAVTLQLLAVVEHAVRRPTAVVPRCSHDAVDDKVVIGVFVEQQVLVTVSRWKDSEYSRIIGSLINASSKTLVRFTQVCDLLQAKGYQTIESETAERD